MSRSVLIFIIIIVFNSWGCTKNEDSYNLDHPFIIMDTDPVIKVGSVDVTAKLLQRADDEIISHGFVWYQRRFPTLDGLHFLFQGNIEGETYSHTINTESLYSDSLYYVRAYIKTPLYEIYSNTYTFRKK